MRVTSGLPRAARSVQTSGAYLGLRLRYNEYGSRAAKCNPVCYSFVNPLHRQRWEVTSLHRWMADALLSECPPDAGLAPQLLSCAPPKPVPQDTGGQFP